jgi:hypothetical protein
MRAVVILQARRISYYHKNNIPTHLICHDHDTSVTQAIRVLVGRPVLQSHNLLDCLDFCILHNLLVICLPNIQQLSAEREDSKVISSGNAQASLSKRLGGVAFRQNQSTFLGLATTSIVGIGELCDTGEAIILLSSAPKYRSYLLTACACDHRFSCFPGQL